MRMLSTPRERWSRRRVRSLTSTGSRPSRWRWSYGATVLILGFSANIPLLQTDPGWAFLYVIGAVLLLAKLLRERIYLPVEPGVVFLTLFLAVVVFAAVGSDFPWSTIRTTVALCGTTLLGIYLGLAFGPPHLMRLVFWSLMLICGASLFLLVVLPEVAIDRTNVVVGWKGLLLHKNALGMAAALLAGVAAISFRWRTLRRQIAGLGVLVALVVALGAGSRTGLVAVSLLLLLTQTLPRTKHNGLLLGRMFLVAGLGGMGLLVLAWLYYLTSERVQQMVEGNLYRLTGRADIWNGVLEGIAARPLLGYGYGGFWHGIDGPSAMVIRSVYGYVPVDITGFIPEHAHNMVLEVALATGFIGATAFVLYFLTCLWRSWSLSLANPTAETHFFFVFAVLVMIYAPVEFILPTYQSTYWMLLVAFSMQIARFPHNRLRIKQSNGSLIKRHLPRERAAL